MVAGAYPPPISNPFRRLYLDPTVRVLVEFFLHGYFSAV